MIDLVRVRELLNRLDRYADNMIAEGNYLKKTLKEIKDELKFVVDGKIDLERTAKLKELGLISQEDFDRTWNEYKKNK